MTAAADLPRTEPAFVMSARDWAILVICAVCWGSAYTFNRILVGELPALSITCGRILVAIAFLLAIMRLQGIALPRDAASWKPFFLFTLFSNVVPFLFILRGQKETASGLAAVIGATTPVFVILIAHVFTPDETSA